MGIQTGEPTRGAPSSPQDGAWWGVLVMVVTAAALAPWVLLNPLNNLDELIIYQWCRRIVHGFVPYRDFHLIVWPHSFEAGALLLRLFGDHLMVLRAAFVVVGGLMSSLAYAVARRAGATSAWSLAAASATALTVGATRHYNYNTLAVLFAAVAVLLLLGRPRRTALWVGVAVGLATLCKHTVGAYVLMASLLSVVVLAPAATRRAVVTELAQVAAGWGAVVGLALSLMLPRIGVGAFLSATVGDALALASRCQWSYFALLDMDPLLGTLVAFALPCSLLLLAAAAWRHRRDRPRREAALVVLAVASATFLLAFPASSLGHVVGAAPLPLVALVVGASLLGAGHRVALALILATALPLLFIDVMWLRADWAGSLPRSRLRHFEGIPRPPREDADDALVVAELARLSAEGRTVFFLDHRAPTFTVPADLFPWRYDSLLDGAMGRGAPEAVEAQLRATPSAAAIVSVADPAPREVAQMRAFVQGAMHRRSTVDQFAVYTW